MQENLITIHLDKHFVWRISIEKKYFKFIEQLLYMEVKGIELEFSLQKHCRIKLIKTLINVKLY